MTHAIPSWLAGAALALLAAAAPAGAQAPSAQAPASVAKPQSKPFAKPQLASDAVRVEAEVRGGAGGGSRKAAAQWRRDGEKLAREDQPGAALIAFSGAAAADPGDWRNWQAFAEAAGAVETEEDGERRRLQRLARAGAYLAYQRAPTARDEAKALALLGRLLTAQEDWRPALDAYRASLLLAEDGAAREAYEGLVSEHGFRILDYKVDSDAAAPRACFTFSEDLPARTDLAPFVSVSGLADAAVTAEGQQVCVDGMRHGERYGVVLRAGLPSALPGESLAKAADYQIYVRDRSPQVRFTGRNYVLPRTARAAVPLVSVNAPRIDVEVARIGDRGLLPALRSEEFLSQLTGASARALAKEKGVPAWKGTLDAEKADVNREAVTAFPVLEAVGKAEPGLYVMTAKPSGTAPASDEEEGGYEAQATQWFVVSDLGLTVLKGPDGVHVLVRSLATAEAVPGAEIRLVARNNDVLATKATDAQGGASFDPGLSRGEGGAAPSLVVARLGDDYGFLDLALGAFDLADRGARGRAAPAGADAYLFPERGVYRPGETVQLTALLRDARGEAMPGIPLTIVARRPDGVEYRRAAVPDAGSGGRSYPLPLLSGAQPGTWRVSAHLDPKGPPVGESSFLVEDYVPERLDVTLTPKAQVLVPGRPAVVDVAARYLYGAPGSNLQVGGTVTVQAAATTGVPGLEGYATGLDDDAVVPVASEIEGRVATDAQGRASVPATVPDASSARPLEARVTLQVGEPGGRGVQRSVTLPILPTAPVIALRRVPGDLRDGGTAAFDVVAARPDGTRLAAQGAAWTLKRVERSYQWYRAEGRWSYEAVKTTRKVASGTIDLAAGAPARITVPVGLGSYRMEVQAAGLQRAGSGFVVGWDGGQTADAPDLLELALDKPAYAAGETLRARIDPRFAGKATVAVVGSAVHELRTLDVPAGGATVEIPVKGSWGPGAYLVAAAYRPLDQAAKRLPGRSLGLSWFSVDRTARILDVALDVPARTRPRSDMRVPVRISGLRPGDEARVAVAAVDVGILSLTRQAAPDPAAHFLGQKAFPAEMRDVYGFLIDGMQGTLGAIRSGGDAGARELSGSPPSQEPVSLYSGIVRVAADGTAEVVLPLPAFNGTVRVTAVAWTSSRVGSAAADVTVRDPVVVSAAIPRFLNAGDASRLRVDIDNVEGPAGDYTVEASAEGPVSVPASPRAVRLEAGGKAALDVPLSASAPGDARIELRLTGPGMDAPIAQRLALRVKPAADATVRRSVRTIQPGGTLSLTGDLLADMTPGTGAVTVSDATLPGLDAPGLLRALERYPYECTEQTVSRALPLLNVSRLAPEAGEGAGERVRAAIERVLSRQDAGGDFGLWSASGTGDGWLVAYVADFLTRARERGHAVPQGAFNLALDRLRNTVANNPDVTGGGADLAYAAYVLARNGRPVMGDLRYLADTKLAAFTTPLARGQVAAALALLGDKARAAKAFEAAAAALRAERDKGEYRADYGSRLRDGAGLVALATESGIAGASSAALASVLAEESATGRATSTQEDAWMLMAAEAAAGNAPASAVAVDGDVPAGRLHRAFPSARLAGGPVVLANRGVSPVQVSVGVSGNPAAPEPAESRGYAVERSYHRLDGTAADLGQVRQNDRLVVVVKVTEQKAQGARILVVDRLPAGFEIDNPRLLDADAVPSLPWLRSDVQPTHVEFRDDRFAASFDRDPGQGAFLAVAYVVRAVTPGRYAHPAASVEDMYRPDRYGRTAFGTLEVGPAR